jgi:hypothetical protein
MQRPLMTAAERNAFRAFALAKLEDEFMAWQQATFRLAAMMDHCDVIEMAGAGNTAVNVADDAISNMLQMMREEAAEALTEPKAWQNAEAHNGSPHAQSELPK